MARNESLITIGDYESIPDGEDGATDFTSLYADEVITIIVCGKKFNAHRKLLSAKSPVLTAMFKYEFKEKGEKQVEINDIDPKVFEVFLHYAYKGKLDQQTLDGYGLHLWILADKYQIDPLKRLCEENMLPELSAKNVVDILLLAQLHNITRIRLRCIEYINTHSAEVLKRKDQWRFLVSQATPELFSDMYRDLSLRKAQSDERILLGGRGNLSRSTRSLAETQASYQREMNAGSRVNSRTNLLATESYTARKSRGSLDSTGEFMRILSYFSFVAICLGFIVFLGYVIYSGITVSTAYLILVIVFALVVIYVCIRWRIPWCKNKI